MTILAYLLLIPCCYTFSTWIYNKCILIGGFRVNEPIAMDIQFSLAIPLTILCLRIIFTQ